MKANIFLSICLMVGYLCLTNDTFAQSRDQGIGLRIGDPMGITYKSYFSNKAALEFTLGSPSANRFGHYYKRTFQNQDKYKSYVYISHTVNYTVAVQGRLLLHESFPARVEGRLDWYWGIGGHVRFSGIEYSYFDQENVIRKAGHTNIDLGPEGILGVEYEFLDFPIVCFSEVSLMGELIDKPFKFRFFGAVGIRYAF